MGGATRQKQEELAQAEADFQQKFASLSKDLEVKRSVPVPPVSKDFSEYKGFFIRDAESFQLKTKSKDRDKQRLEFVRHVFHKYPVPDFMAEAWKTPVYRHVGIGGHVTFEPSISGFAVAEDYRLWYICMATGGSFYKEYGNYLFTKQESHIFVNCKHDLTIQQAIVYSIAYAESHNMGRSLRIAKAKINEFNLFHPYWRDVIRFFARQEPESVESINDILDYIVFKRQENSEFTIIGKGHTLKSLADKVEQWHQDLRRLKSIGDNVWEGIPVKDREYTKKNSDNTIDYWKFTQIKCAKDLQKEGNAMRHCVLSYKSRCLTGECSIWSATFNEERKLTIEVRRGDVVQVRGKANRMIRPHEKTVVQKWAMDSGFYYR